MLILADADGVVKGSITGLHHFARVPPEDCQIAVDKFLKPDPGTSTKANDGRRIEEIDGGWRILNHAKYREMMSLAERQAYWRKRKQESREREKAAFAGMTTRQIIRNTNKAKAKLGIE